MTINSVLNPQADTQAQEIYNDYIIDVIQSVGTDWYYLPRTMVEEDILLREDVHSIFNNAYIIEGYIAEEEGFLDSQALLGREGINFKLGGNLIISRTRFHEQVPSVVRPFEGDLVYSSLYRQIFEVKHVEHEKPFHQLQDLTMYQLKIMKYEYNHDTFDTDIAEIDEIQYKYGYQIKLSYSNMIGTFEVGDNVTQILTSGIVITGKVASIDVANSIISITDIKSTDELQLHFAVSSTDLLLNDDADSLQITKIFDIDSTLTDEESKHVMSHDDIQQNQFIEKDEEDYVETTTNPYW